MKIDEGNICGCIFINYGELHNNYQHSEDNKCKITVDYLNENIQMISHI